MTDGKTDIVDMLTEYIDSTNASINRYRHIMGVSRYAPRDMIVDLVSGKINGNQFVECCRKAKPVKCEEIYSVEEGAKRLKSDCDTLISADIVLDTVLNATIGFTETVNFYIDMLSNSESGNKISALEKINGIEELINSAITSLKEAVI